MANSEVEEWAERVNRAAQRWGEQSMHAQVMREERALFLRRRAQREAEMLRRRLRVIETGGTVALFACIVFGILYALHVVS